MENRVEAIGGIAEERRQRRGFRAHERVCIVRCITGNGEVGCEREKDRQERDGMKRTLKRENSALEGQQRRVFHALD